MSTNKIYYWYRAAYQGSDGNESRPYAIFSAPGMSAARTKAKRKNMARGRKLLWVHEYYTFEDAIGRI